MSNPGRVEAQLLSFLDDHQAELNALLQKLIQFDTQNFISSGREAACQDYIEQWFEQQGFRTERYAPDSVPGLTEHKAYNPGRGTDERENVTAFYQQEAAGDDALMLAAHTDTMPVGELSAWKHPPFGGVMEDGRIYGLGAGDNKAGLAAGMMAFLALRSAGVQMKHPVLMTAYVDEEYGGGGGALAACLQYPCASYLNLDAGNFELWTSSLGGGGFELDISLNHPTDTASTLFPAVNLVHDALMAWKKDLQTRLQADPLYTDSDMMRSALRITTMRIGDQAVALNRAQLGFVVYALQDEDSVRTDLATFLDPVRNKLRAQGIEISEPKNTTRYFEHGRMADDSPMLETLERSIVDATGRSAPRRGACLSDLSIFQAYGSADSVGFGILRDFALEGGAHQPDEFVETQDLLDHCKALVLFLYRYAGTQKKG